MDSYPKCYRCGKEPSQQLTDCSYWCSWCGQAFNPKDESVYKNLQSSSQSMSDSDIKKKKRAICDLCNAVIERPGGYLFQSYLICEKCLKKTKVPDHTLARSKARDWWEKQDN